MAQHDYSIANQTAASLRTDLNNVLSAIVSNNSGATAPADTYANMFWYDTTANILKMRNEADDAWISLGYLDQTADAFRILDNTQVTNTSGTQTGLLGDQSTATWETGTGTTESLVSPAKVKAAIDSNTADLLALTALSNTWHPYDRTTVAGSQDGNIYNSAVDGTVASIESPAFEAGYEYMFYFEQVTGSSGATLQAQMHRDDTASYESLFALTGVTVTVGQGIWGSVIIPQPKISRYSHDVLTNIRIFQSTGAADNIVIDRSYRVSIPWTAGKVKFTWSVGSFNNGKVFMYRRREGISA